MSDDGVVVTADKPNRNAIMKFEKMLEEIRDTNLTYLVLAQRLVREDHAQALYRLGLTESVADTIASLTMAQILKIASTNTLVCRIRMDDEIVWNLLTSYSKDHNVAGIHAAILVSSKLAETV